MMSNGNPPINLKPEHITGFPQVKILRGCIVASLEKKAGAAQRARCAAQQEKSRE
jgi:hypothetical protein